MKAQLIRRRTLSRIRRRGRRRTKPGCDICGADSFAHKPNGYYGHVEHAYKKQ